MHLSLQRVQPSFAGATFRRYRETGAGNGGGGGGSRGRSGRSGELRAAAAALRWRELWREGLSVTDATVRDEGTIDAKQAAGAQQAAHASEVGDVASPTPPRCVGATAPV